VEDVTALTAKHLLMSARIQLSLLLVMQPKCNVKYLVTHQMFKKILNHRCGAVTEWCQKIMER